MPDGGPSPGGPESPPGYTGKVRTLSWGQRGATALLLAAIACGMYWDWMATIIAVNAVVLALITAGNIMKLWLPSL